MFDFSNQPFVRTMYSRKFDFSIQFLPVSNSTFDSYSSEICIRNILSRAQFKIITERQD